MKKKLVMVAVCCNDLNGNPLGQCDAIEIAESLLHLESAFWDAPICTFRHYQDRQQVRLGRRVFRIYEYKSWYGSWCWDAFLVDLETLNKMMGHLEGMRGRLHLVEGNSEVFKRWENREPIRFGLKEDKGG